jgi:hypothetical protein
MISRNKIAVVFFAIAIISIASYGYLYIKDHQDWRVTPELRVLPPYIAYGYYGVTDFIQGDMYNSPSHGKVPLLNFIHLKSNKTWFLKNQINKTIRFNLTGPNGEFLEGDFMPNVSIVNDTFYTDLLIINWNDTIQKGSCYSVIAYSGGKSASYYYNKSMGIGQYDQIPVNFPLKLISGSLSVFEYESHNCSRNESETWPSGGPSYMFRTTSV